MKTLDPDSITNSLLMACAKEFAKNDISIYEFDKNQMLRNLLAPFTATVVADYRAKMLAASISGDQL